MAEVFVLVWIWESEPCIEVFGTLADAEEAGASMIGVDFTILRRQVL